MLGSRAVVAGKKHRPSFPMMRMRALVNVYEEFDIPTRFGLKGNSGISCNHCP